MRKPWERGLASSESRGPHGRVQLEGQHRREPGAVPEEGRFSFCKSAPTGTSRRGARLVLRSPPSSSLPAGPRVGPGMEGTLLLPGFRSEQ